MCCVFSVKIYICQVLCNVYDISTCTVPDGGFIPSPSRVFLQEKGKYIHLLQKQIIIRPYIHPLLVLGL